MKLNTQLIAEAMNSKDKELIAYLNTQGFFKMADKDQQQRFVNAILKIFGQSPTKLISYQERYFIELQEYVEQDEKYGDYELSNRQDKKLEKVFAAIEKMSGENIDTIQEDDNYVAYFECKTREIRDKIIKTINAKLKYDYLQALDYSDAPSHVKNSKKPNFK